MRRCGNGTRLRIFRLEDAESITSVECYDE